MPSRPLLRPSLSVHADIVDALRVKLPQQAVDLPTVCRLLAWSDSTTYTKEDVLAALIYLEKRGEVRRITGGKFRGWCLPARCTAQTNGGTQLELRRIS
jgi:hypothetical protein